MASVYFGWKLFIEVLPVIIWVILFAIGLIVIIVRGTIESRKINYLKYLGFERYLINVASVGNKAWYGWRRDDKNEYLHISEKDLAKISYKELKKRFPL